VAEAWGSDGALAARLSAARTERMLLGSGDHPARHPHAVAIAQTAMTLSPRSPTGASSWASARPARRSIEGLHGSPSTARCPGCGRPSRSCGSRSGEKISYKGGSSRSRCPAGKGAHAAVHGRRAGIPIYLAALSPKMLELTGEIADGWLGTSFVPEGAKEAYFDHLDAGLANAGRVRADLDICQGAEIAFADDEDRCARWWPAARRNWPSASAAWARETNFYNNAYSRQGWAEVAAEVRERWQAGDRDGAAALVTDEMVLATTLIGTEDMVRERLRVWRTPASTPSAVPGRRDPRSASSPPWAGPSTWSDVPAGARHRSQHLGRPSPPLGR
jgi:alkanesulfonate monooxygenase SsuD/methylene tetrahydromethanopterin reductase-like flavin-dependent oxidoreductase (luciferase family)